MKRHRMRPLTKYFGMRERYGGDYGGDKGFNLARTTGLCKGTKMSETLSKQALACLEGTFVARKDFASTFNNRYHPTANPEGVADLGVADNKMCEDLLIQKMNEIALRPEPNELLYYDITTGNKSLRQTMTEFVKRKFHPADKITVDNVYITNGVTVILETMSFMFADPGDYIMQPCPHYYRIRLDIFERPGVKTLDVPLAYLNGDTQGGLTLSAEVLEQVYQQAVSEGKRVRAVILNNPVNPTGDVIGREQLVDLLDFAHRHNLHVLSNEIYGLSIHDPNVKFTSILSIPHPDPMKVHFAWGVSKDTGLSGYRCGIVFSRNPTVLQYLNKASIYYRGATPIQYRLNMFFGDHEWIDQTFFPTMQGRLHERFVDLRDVLQGFEIPVHPSTATMFIWADFSKFLPVQTYESEQWLSQQFLKEKVFVVPGFDHSPPKPGWFRIVYSVDPDVYEEGKKRIISVLRRLQSA